MTGINGPCFPCCIFKVLLLGYPHEGSGEGQSALTLCLEEGGGRVGRGTFVQARICLVSFSPALGVPIIALNSCDSFTYSVQNMKMEEEAL